MGIYYSTEDFQKLTLDHPWLEETSWVQYYRDLIDGKNPFSVNNTKYEFKFGTGDTTKTLYKCLVKLYEYQSLDKFLEPDPNPHVKPAEKQMEQEMILLKYVFPNHTIETYQVMPEGADPRNYPSRYKHRINGIDLYVNRNRGIMFCEKIKLEGNLDKTCYVCKDELHETSDCPVRCECGGYHQPESHKCFMCGKEGFDHLQKDCEMTCPCGYYHRRDEHKCYVCKRAGYDHDESDCPDRCKCSNDMSKDHLPEDHRCYSCKEIGYTHDYKDCPNYPYPKDDEE